jgi:hypothetical protein
LANGIKILIENYDRNLQGLIFPRKSHSKNSWEILAPFLVGRENKFWRQKKWDKNSH